MYRYLSAHMIRPMANIISNVREIGGNAQGRLPQTGINDFDALVADINDMLDRTQKYNMSLHISQIDAHFVVNTLKSIKHLSEIGENDKAAQMSDGLAAILNHQHTGDEMINVFADFEILRKYIEIMNIKFGGRFTVEYNLDYDLEACVIPAMILQPITENALCHGLQSKENDAKLLIKGVIEENYICFEFSDNGTGIPPAKLKAIRESLLETETRELPEPGLHGVALANIQKRIRLKFGADYGLTIESDWNKGTTATLKLPAVSDCKI